jgi:hypothetical protein
LLIVEANPVQAAPTEEAIKPPRLNFARVCLRCEHRDCESPQCIAWHAESSWMVCPDCDGMGWTDEIDPCGCFFGVVEAAVAPAPASRLAAV